MILVVAGLFAATLLSAWAFTWWRAGVIAKAYAPAGGFVKLGDGTRVHYTERRPTRPPRGTVVLLHGASGNQADLMLPLGDRLAALGFRVIAPDRPGHGWSDRPDGAGDASPAQQARILLQAFERIGVSHAIMVGHSWSGTLAANFALDHPGFVDGLVLLAPVLYPWPGGIAWYYNHVSTPWLGPAFTHLLTLPLGLALIDSGVAEVFAPQSPPPDFARRTGVYLVLRPSELTANAQDVRGLQSFVVEQGPRVKEIAAPTAIITGDGDRVVSPELHAMRAAKEIAGASLQILHGAGHSPHWTDPEGVAAAVVEVADRARSHAPVAAQ